MVLFNYSTKELTAKIVYYGPGLCGKTTNLQFIHGNLPDTVKGKMLSLATKTDRTLFFDFLPIDLGEIRGMKTRVQLYTVPGQVFYNETRKLVLKGADGIVFVADSQQQMLGANVESFKNLEDNLKGHGLSLAGIPHVLQFNKRDLPKLSSIEELNAAINHHNAPFYESVATTGIGVQDSLKAITKLVLLNLTKKYEPRTAGATEARPAPSAPAGPPQRPAPAAPSFTPPVVEQGGGIPLSEMAAAPLDLATAQPQAVDLAAPQAAVPELSQQPVVAQEVVEPEIDLTEPAPPDVAQFDNEEIDDLVNEVEEIEAMPEPSAPIEQAEEGDALLDGVPGELDLGDVDNIPEVKFPDRDPMLEAPQDVEARSFEVDLNHDPAWDDAAPADGESTESTEESTELPAETTLEAALRDPSAFEGGETVRLTEEVQDQDLFDDPGLDIARMNAGEEREIVIPVELGDDAETRRRFKLSVKLRLDPVE